MSTAPIQATEAHITTATVEVRVLRIGAKQMTLAVFRQLPRDDDIAGEAWGRVNYHNDCHGRHEHVIWQAGGELRHAVIWEPGKEPELFLEGDDWAQDLWDRWVLGGWKVSIRFPYNNQNAFTAVTEQGVRVHGRLSDQAKWAMGEGANRSYLEERVARSGRTTDELGLKFSGEVEEELALHAKRTARWQMVIALPQLFVAV